MQDLKEGFSGSERLDSHETKTSTEDSQWIAKLIEEKDKIQAELDKQKEYARESVKKQMSTQMKVKTQ